MPNRADNYDDFITRRGAEGEQKRRLCEFAATHIIERERLKFTDKPVSLFVGPGTTMPVFVEMFIERLVTEQLLKSRRLSLVSNNLGIFQTIEQKRDKPLDILLYGERVDLKNWSLRPSRTSFLDTFLRRAKASFAVLSCASIWRSGSGFCIGGFTEAHARVLGQAVRSGLDSYLIADDWKRLLDVSELSVARLEGMKRIFHQFATIPRDSRQLTLIVEAEGRPEAYRGSDRVLQALEAWWKKPQQPTCFLSYSTKYQEQADRLYSGLRAKGIRCAKWDRTIDPFDPLWRSIEESIVSHPPLILLCGKHSLESGQVLRELEYACAKRIQILTIKIDHALAKWSPAAEYNHLKQVLEGDLYINARGMEEPEIIDIVASRLRQMSTAAR